MGIGRYARCGRMVGLELDVMEPLFAQMRLCFAEAAAHIKYFGEIESDDTRGYILRALANRALGQFHSVGERVRLLKETMEVFRDPFYRSIAPALPWDRLCSRPTG